MPKNYYAILGVEQDASYADIKKAWRDNALKWHPDRFQAEQEKLTAHKSFVDIAEAYSVLIDAQQRAAYDRLAASEAAGTYAGSENANPAQDQQEAAKLFQRILDEDPSEFWMTTLLVLILSPVTLTVILGLFGIVYAFYEVITGQSDLGIVGALMLMFLFFANLLVAGGVNFEV